jgi:basic amino acid/polyamine antiporter, APA family
MPKSGDPPQMSSTRGTFVRDSTGLVRSLGFLDQLVVSQSIIIFLNSFVLTSLYAPIFFPGADLVVVFALGSIPAFAMAAVYSIMSAAIPRSGGDYVWSTRILGPLYGTVQFVFVLVTAVIGGLAYPTYYAISIALSQLAFALGVTTRDASLINASSSVGQANTAFAISLAIIAIATAVVLLGLRTFSVFQRIATLFFLLVAAGFIVLLALVNSSTIPGLFNGAMSTAGSNVTYNSIIQQASASSSFNWTNTLLAAIPWGFLAFTGFNYGTYLSGETRNVKSSMTRALFISVAIATVLMVVMSALSYNDFGVRFLNSVSYVEANNGSALPTLITTSLLVSLSSPAIAGFIGIGLFVGFIVVSISYLMTISRMIFAASFDRLLPSKFAEVNDRFHSPVYAVSLLAALWVVVTAIIWYGGFISTLLNTSLIAPIGYSLPLVATLVFYWRKKDLFKRTASGVNRPVVLIVSSLVGIVAFIFYIFAETFPIISGTFLGASLSLAYELVGAFLVIGILIYAVAVARLRGSGVDFRQAYNDIPPE